MLGSLHAGGPDSVAVGDAPSSRLAVASPAERSRQWQPNELAGLSQFQEDLDGCSDRIFRSLDILARALHVKNAELEPALQAIVSTAVTTLSSAQHAGLITVSCGELVPQATTGRPPQLLDQLQQKLKDGPCIDAAEQQTLIRIDDMRRESRWPDFAAEAESLGVCSMLCVPLRVHERCLGTLSLYSERVTPFTGHDERVTTLFATLAAIALAEASGPTNCTPRSPTGT